MSIFRKLLSNLPLLPASRSRWRHRLLYDWGKNNNHVYRIRSGQQKELFWPPKGLNIKIVGKNNIIEITEPVDLQNSFLTIEGNNCYVSIGKCIDFNNFSARLHGSHRKLIIGPHSTFGGNFFYIRERDLIIGQDCMFSDGIDIMTSDSHTILNEHTHQPFSSELPPPPR